MKRVKIIIFTQSIHPVENSNLPQDDGPTYLKGDVHRRYVMVMRRRVLGWVLAGATFAVTSILTGPGTAVAVDVGEPAPDFKLPGTMGSDVSLSDFRGKKWVLLEFYGADFSPT
jgi:hypothetical protein